MKTPAAITLACLSLAIAGASPVAAQQARTARPHVSATIASKGFEKTLTVRLTESDTGKPIARATVTAAAEMRRPHLMTFSPRPLTERSRGIYRVRADFLMAGMTVTIAASGKNFRKATYAFVATTIAAHGDTRLSAASS